MKSYHFDLGNSTDGPIGYCAVVVAGSPEAAVERLKKHIAEEIEADEWWDESRSGEYARVYINLDAITVAAIDFEEEREAEVEVD